MRVIDGDFVFPLVAFATMVAGLYGYKAMIVAYTYPHSTVGVFAEVSLDNMGATGDKRFEIAGD